MTKKEITKLSFEITGFAIKVHKRLGPGLLESVYEQCLKFELERNGYDVKQQLVVKIEYDNLELESTLRIDLLVNDSVIVELKTVENI
jgi:GxxExxY protein